MAKRIIVLGTQQLNGQVSVDCVMWFAITSGARVTTAGSQWTGRSAAENTAILAGTVIEERRGLNYPQGLAVASIKAALEQEWTVRNAALNGLGPAQNADLFFDPATGGWSS